jgi:ABC-type sugar transport system ATPase subunit
VKHGPPRGAEGRPADGPTRAAGVTMGDFILEMRNITKEFPGVRALDDVTFQVRRGEIHALVGENGAGKSTLMKVLSGVYPHGTYGGDIVLDGAVQRYAGIHDAERAGIAIIYQELALVRQMTVAENIFLGAELKRGPGIVDWNATYSQTARVLKEVGLRVNPATRVIDLSIGSQQLVEIAKALSKEARLLILDEPTAALTETETENLLGLLDALRKKGVTCIYISHRLREVTRIADRVTVLRDGRTVITEPIGEMPIPRMIHHMVGRELTNMFPHKERRASDVVLEVRNWTIEDPVTGDVVVEDASFQVRKGEILGFAGLMGAGRTELVMSLFGAWGRKRSGEMLLDGKRLEVRGPRDAIQAGLALVSEDRKRYGLVLGMDVKQNSTLASLRHIARFGIIDPNEEIKRSDRYVTELRTKTPSLEQKVGNLSGGNQQKVVLAKWLLTQPKVLFLDEPTRGIDVGAKVEIYNIMNELVAQGVCVVMVSSELPEVLGVSDVIVVIHEGRISGRLAHAEATEEKVMHHATGGA